MFCAHEDICDQTCFDCEENQKKISDLKYWFKSVLDQLYSNESLDLHDLENCLDEVAHLLHMRLPKKDLEIQRAERLPEHAFSNVKRIDILPIWVEWNNNYLKTINQ